MERNHKLTAGELLEMIVKILKSGKRVVLHIYIGGHKINKIEHTKEGFPE